MAALEEVGGASNICHPRQVSLLTRATHPGPGRRVREAGASDGARAEPGGGPGGG